LRKVPHFGVGKHAFQGVIPEVEISPDQIACEFRQGYEGGKRRAIAVVAEGAHHNGQSLLDFFRVHEEGSDSNCV